MAVANVGVAVADLYPRFSLTGSLSSRGGDFGQLFRENNNAWSLGGNLLQPLFQGGALRATVRAQKAAAEQAAETYRKTLITAVSEVEDALIAYGNYTSQMQYLHKENNANREAFLLSRTLYINGQTPYAGLSEWMVGAAFRGETTLADPVAKLGMTALTVGAGLQGGEVTPLFGIGASLGGWIGQVTMGDPSLVAALGMVGVFGAALNVPITTIMLGIDMFGAQAAGYFVIVGFVSYLAAGHAAVYPAQRIVTPKRRGLKDDAALTVEGALERHRRELEELMDE